jgi:hypothetical protein
MDEQLSETVVQSQIGVRYDSRGLVFLGILGGQLNLQFSGKEPREIFT